MLVSSIGVVYAQGNPVFAKAYNLSNDENKAGQANVQNSGSHVYVAWSESSYGISFRSSPNGGVTWDPPLTSSALRLSVAGGVSQFPLMITNGGSYVYATWAQTLNQVLQVYFTASSNYGASFTTAKVVDNMPTAICITPVIAAYGNDVYVAYDGNGSSYVTASSNNGATWTVPFNYSSGPEPQLAAWGRNAYAISVTLTRSTTALAVTHNNGVSWTKSQSSGGSEPWISAYGANVLAAWETKGNESNIEIITSTNSGVKFTKPFNLSSAVQDAWAPMTGIFGNTEYVAWRTNPGGPQSQEYVSVSINSGLTWCPPIEIGVPGHDNEWPFTVEPSLNNVYIMWAEETSTNTSSNDWQILVTYSSNNGTSWTAPAISLTSSVDSGSAPEADVATGAISSSGSSAYSAWENNATTPQIYFSSS